MKSYTARVLAVIAIVSIVINILLYFRYSTSRPLVTVGDAVITKKQFSDQLEHDAGQTVLTRLVFSNLVAQAAAHAGLMPTEQDITDRIQVISRQAPQMLVPYNQDPAKMTQFRQDLATNIALENLRIQDVALTPAQIADYYTRHNAEFALPPQTLTTTVVTQNAVDAGTAAELLRQQDPPDVVGRQTGLRVVGMGGYDPDLQALPPALRQQISSYVGQAATGSVKTFRAGTFYLTFRVNGHRPGAAPPLEKVRGEVERAARLELAPTQPEELARLYHNARPTFNSDRYAAYFASVENYPLGVSRQKKTAELP